MPAKMNDVCPYCEEHLHDMTDGVAAAHIKECRDIHKADFDIGDMISFFSGPESNIDVVVWDEDGPKKVNKK
jgi:hypothetical protein